MKRSVVTPLVGFSNLSAEMLIFLDDFFIFHPKDYCVRYVVPDNIVFFNIPIGIGHHFRTVSDFRDFAPQLYCLLYEEEFIDGHLNYIIRMDLFVFLRLLYSYVSLS